MEKIIRKMNTKLFLLALGLFFIPGIFACPSTHNMKPSFSLGDEVSFNYTLLSNVNEDITYIPAVICPNARVPLRTLLMQLCKRMCLIHRILFIFLI